MRGFEARGDAAVAELDSEERAVVARVIADVGLLLDGESFGTERDVVEDAEDELFRHLRGFEAALSDPEDPAVLRILPNAAPTDREVADEFRRFTEPELRATKLERLRVMWLALSEDGPEWEVPADQAMATAAALTDVRLVLAARLGLDTDDDADALHREIDMAGQAIAAGTTGSLGVNPERVWLGMLYQALTWLQESLMSYVMRDDV